MKVFFLLVMAIAILTSAALAEKKSTQEPLEIKKDDVENQLKADEKKAIDPVQVAASLKNPFKSQLPRKNLEKKPKAETTVMPPKPPINSSIPPSGTAATDTINIPNFTISGLVWNSDKPQAIVNDQIVGIGDMVNGFEVKNIEEDSIEIFQKGRTFRINPNFKPKFENFSSPKSKTSDEEFY